MSIPVCLALIISIPRKIYEITKKKKNSFLTKFGKLNYPIAGALLLWSRCVRWYETKKGFLRTAEQ